jgi:1-deoxy-D-xylulose-5-phosphate reductoisomerase
VKAPQAPQAVTILGSTGSIGVNTLDVLRRNPGRYRVVALTAQRNVDLLAAQCSQFNAEFAVIGDAALAASLEQALAARQCAAHVLAGPEGLAEAATLPGTDVVMAAIVGAAGLTPTILAARAGKKVLLANKESLVIAGHLFMQAVRVGGATVLPVDSEHNAIFQALPADFAAGLETVGVDRIILTASGGPFLDLPADRLHAVTPAQACKHPNWEMGRKISVDSATLMNKGLELIEAHWLFNAPEAQLEVLIHPQSIVHSMVAYRDGSVLAQLGTPDMRTPIAYALAWPERIEAGVERLDLTRMAELTFRQPDVQRFPCLRLAREAMQEGENMPVVLNAANEVAVQAFLDRQIRFDQIPALVDQTLERSPRQTVHTVDDILQYDAAARRQALEIMRAMT